MLLPLLHMSEPFLTRKVRFCKLVHRSRGQLTPKQALMSVLHEIGISKSRRIVGYVLSILASLGIFGSGIIKFFPTEKILFILEQLNLSEYTIMIGLIEIFVVVIYWIPKTSNFGFFLFCSYIGAIIVGELVIGELPLPGLTTGAMIFIGTLLRKPSLLGWSSASAKTI